MLLRVRMVASDVGGGLFYECSI